jgi:two-component system, chemotaxis family, chemotaxis protein CheY
LARKILLADDSVTAQNMGRKILADAGYEVITVNNGSAALKKIAEFKPDLVILDVYMPGYSGLEVCQRLKDSQDSSRIPVLLSVGKLEPFKPEEAHRVRAEGFIVKPFEASELLSALSKLEDKVVPRAEPSKPGRFARAVAAQEESGRGRSEQVSEEDGWKNRIAFPHQKTETEQREEKAADDAAIYNPINRDLRTVVETPEEKKQQALEHPPAAAAIQVEDASVDVAALAPAGLPHDVTPEELAAIAAAAAQIHAIQNETRTEISKEIAKDQNKDEERVAEPSIPTVSSEVSQSSPVVVAEQNPVEPIHLAQPEAREDSSTERTETVAAVAIALAPDSHNDSHHEADHSESHDVPMTMAADPAVAVASHHGAPRWTAVSVALEAEEASLSLEHEMQKAYAAFVAEETASRENLISAEPAPPVQASVVESSSSAPVSEPEAPAAQTAPEIIPETTVQPEIISATLFVPEPVAAQEASDVAGIPVASQNSPSEDLPSEANDEDPAALAQRACELAQKEFVAQEPVHVTSTMPGAVALQELPVAPSAEPVMADTTHSDNHFAPIVRAEEPHVEPPTESSETVKSTAAAWASWRQIRDASEAKPAPEPSRPEFETHAPPADESAAMAVAAGAGAEQLSHDVDTSSPTNEGSNDVASIVESVLADLRPRLMAEISRKMAEKK